MKIYNKIVYDINDNIIEEDSYEYNGPIAKCDWITAAATTAAPYVVAGSSIIGIQQAGKIGAYNAAVNNRKAEVLEQEGKALDAQLEFDLTTFDKEFKKLEGKTKVSQGKSGAVIGEGTGRRIEIANMREAEIQKNNMRYNSQVAQAKKFEEASFARIGADLARQQARFEQVKIATQAGTSLLTMTG